MHHASTDILEEVNELYEPRRYMSVTVWGMIPIVYIECKRWRLITNVS